MITSLLAIAAFLCKKKSIKRVSNYLNNQQSAHPFDCVEERYVSSQRAHLIFMDFCHYNLLNLVDLNYSINESFFLLQTNKRRTLLVFGYKFYSHHEIDCVL